MLRGIISALVPAAVLYLIGWFDANTLVILLIIGVVIDVALGKRGPLAVALGGFAITVALVALLVGLASISSNVMVVGGDPLTALGAVVGVAALYWAAYYVVYRLLGRWF
ncbi:MAG: hypothetical protein ABWK05_03015 [Pyrobaculum sp.]